MSHLSSKSFKYLNVRSQLSFSTTSISDKLHQSPLLSSYAKIKSFSKTQQQSFEQQSSASPLLSHLNLIDKNNNLISTEELDNWDNLRELLRKTTLFYINDFCNDFAYKHARNEIISQEFIKRTQFMLIKTNLGGKGNRGILHCISLLSLRKHQKKALSVSDIHNALTIALCIEALQSFFLIMDDVVDESETRRGQLCWYKYPNVGLKAVNDGPIIESWLFWLLNNRILNDDLDSVLLDRMNSLFREVNMLTLSGQATDLELVKDADKMRDIYTMHRYETIAMYKTSFYSFYLPYAAALYLVGYDDKNESSKQLKQELGMGLQEEEIGDGVIDDGLLFHFCRQISINLGIKFQVDDDYLDCFGDPKVTGKVGTDIQDFKCSWIVVKALEMVSDAQYEVLKRHYGKKGEEDVKRVKELFNELGIQNVYKEWEMREHNNLMNMVEQCQGLLPTEMFTLMMDKLHKRNK